MSSYTSIISTALQHNEFESFQELEDKLLSINTNSPLLVALELGLRATTIGQAFALGYRCALQELLPTLPQDQWAAFCVTEEAGVHPKKLTTTLSSDNLISGEKSFVSMADKATQLIVIAVAGRNGDRPLLKAVKVSMPVVGAQVDVMPSMGMMPEVGHGKLTLENVPCEVLEGDGYLDFNKKFRTIEDAHLLMAFTSLILSKSVRFGLDDSLIDECLVIISSLFSLSFEDAPINTLQLSGLYKLFEVLRDKFEIQLSEINAGFKSEWERDSKVFGLSKKTRLVKRNKALEAFSGYSKV